MYGKQHTTLLNKLCSRAHMHKWRWLLNFEYTSLANFKYTGRFVLQVQRIAKLWRMAYNAVIVSIKKIPFYGHTFFLACTIQNFVPLHLLKESCKIIRISYHLIFICLQQDEKRNSGLLVITVLLFYANIGNRSDSPFCSYTELNRLKGGGARHAAIYSKAFHRNNF